MSPRQQTCTRDDARYRLSDARSMMAVADLVVTDDTIPGVAGALAVLAGIAASDAACCAVLGRRHRGQDHRDAGELLKAVEPNGPAMAKDLRRLLSRKDDAHYGLGSLAAARSARWSSGRIGCSATPQPRWSSDGVRTQQLPVRNANCTAPTALGASRCSTAVRAPEPMTRAFRRLDEDALCISTVGWARRGPGGR